MKRILFVCALASFAFVACKSNKTTEVPATETKTENVTPCQESCKKSACDTACMHQGCTEGTQCTHAEANCTKENECCKKEGEKCVKDATDCKAQNMKAGECSKTEAKVQKSNINPAAQNTSNLETKAVKSNKTK